MLQLLLSTPEIDANSKDECEQIQLPDMSMSTPKTRPGGLHSRMQLEIATRNDSVAVESRRCRQPTLTNLIRVDSLVSRVSVLVLPNVPKTALYSEYIETTI